MPRIITLDEKLSILDDWLSGESRNDIATKHNIGSSTVYNIVEKWSNEIGSERADRLREIAIKLKKNGLTISDCAKGLRMILMLKKYGIQDDENQERVTFFLKELYTKCVEVELKPQQVFDYIADILKFSTEISISEIPHFIKKRIEEKEKLESEVEQLSRKKNELTEIKEELEQEIQGLRNNKETMSKTYKTFTITQFKLKQYGIQMDDIDMFVKSVVGMSKENYDYIQILAKIAEHEKLEKDMDYYKEEITRMKNESTKLNQEIHDQKNNLNYYHIKIDFLKELEIRGFGINELRTLFNILNEIGMDYNQNFDEIRKKFFDDVKNYEEIIGSRIEIERLKKELKMLQIQTEKERQKYNMYPDVLDSIVRLTGSGISEEDIVKIAKILSMNDYFIYKDTLEYKEDLIDDLQKYRDLKLAIKNLEDLKRNLKSTKKTQNYKPLKKKLDKVYTTKRRK